MDGTGQEKPLMRRDFSPVKENTGKARMVAGWLLVTLFASPFKDMPCVGWIHP